MLGALIPNGNEAWFLKLQGPDAIVEKLLPDFRSFAGALKLADGKLKWTVPQGWEEQPGGEFRIATLLIPVENNASRELVISRFDAPDGVNDDYIAANITRWRGQLGISPVTAAEIGQVTEKINFDGGFALMVNLVGKSTNTGMGRGPFAGGPMAGGSDAIPSVSANESPREEKAEPGATQFEFKVPDGWKPGKSSMMRAASFEAANGDATADISVFAFPADANDLLSNVNRWRGQIGLKAVTAEELEKSSSKISVDGTNGDLVELIGEKDTILGVMAKKAGKAWFFKLQGPTDLALREKPKFESFVKSWKLP